MAWKALDGLPCPPLEPHLVPLPLCLPGSFHLAFQSEPFPTSGPLLMQLPLPGKFFLPHQHSFYGQIFCILCLSTTTSERPRVHTCLVLPTTAPYALKHILWVLSYFCLSCRLQGWPQFFSPPHLPVFCQETLKFLSLKR